VLTDLLEFVREIYKRKDEGKLKDVIYLDFVKEFDKVPTKDVQKVIGLRNAVYFGKCLVLHIAKI